MGHEKEKKKSFVSVTRERSFRHSASSVAAASEMVSVVGDPRGTRAVLSMP